MDDEDHRISRASREINIGWYDVMWRRLDCRNRTRVLPPRSTEEGNTLRTMSSCMLPVVRHHHKTRQEAATFGNMTAILFSKMSTQGSNRRLNSNTSKDLDDSRGTVTTMDCSVVGDDGLHHDEEADVSAGCRLVASGHHTHAKETRFHTSHIRDSIQVQTHHGCHVNDDEVHEENPHLQDFLIFDHNVHVEPCAKVTNVAAKDGCQHSILHKKSARANDQTPKKKSVHFGTVLVRDYDLILGDHPCCSYGPPITLDWDYLEYKPLSVNEYELHHAPRRSLREMLLNYYQRKHMLTEAGYTEADLKANKKDVNKSKFNRSITRSCAPYHPLEWAVESAVRKMKRIVGKTDHWKREASLYA